MNHISLFSGYEGFGLGLKLAGIPIRTVLYCEIEPYCQKILEQRMEDGYIDQAPIWPDIRSLDGTIFTKVMGEGLLSAGFPCQPFSTAGKQLGNEDFINLWPETGLIIREVRPRFICLENVPALLNGNRKRQQPAYAITVFKELTKMGMDYRSRYGVMGAENANAPHKRQRLWVLAHAKGNIR